MQRPKYTLIQNQPYSSPLDFLVFESKLPETKQEQNTIMSSSQYIYKNANVGYFNGSINERACICCGVKKLAFVMYDQNLSEALTYSKGCLGLQCCEHELVVMTAKKILIGKIKRVACKWFGCSQVLLQITNTSETPIFQIDSPCCQWSHFIPSCLSFLRCSKPVTYDIINSESKKVVGKIEDIPDALFGCSRKFQISFPDGADTKQKILLMNAIAML